MKHSSMASSVSAAGNWLKASLGLGTLSLGLTMVALQSPAAIAQNLGANPLYGQPYSSMVLMETGIATMISLDQSVQRSCLNPPSLDNMTFGWEPLEKVPVEAHNCKLRRYKIELNSIEV